MADRASLLESAQWAIETTPGIAVPATKAVRSMSVMIDVNGPNQLFRPDGHKFNALAIPQMEWTGWKADGPGTYTEMMYLLESIFGHVSPTGVGATGQKRVYSAADTVPDTITTLSIQKGQPVRAHSLAYGLATDYGLTFSRKTGVTIAAQGIGQLLADNIVMTATPTQLPLVPITAKTLDLFIDSTGAALGTTKMLRAFEFNPNITNKYGPIWPIGSTNPSFASHVELAPTTSGLLTLEADAAGMAYLSQYRGGSVIFVRVAATGPIFEAGTPGVAYGFIYDVCLGVKQIQNLGKDVDGVAVVDIDCEIIYDATWGNAIQVTLQNAIATA